MPCAIAYLRVSTGQQGKSGLGIEAQRAAIARFIAAEDYEQIAEFVEVETGKGSDAWSGGHSWPRRWPARSRPRAPARSWIRNRSACCRRLRPPSVEVSGG